MGPVEWGRLSEGLAQAAGRLTDAEIAGVRGPTGLDVVVFYFSPGKSDGVIFPRPWASLRLLGVAPMARGRGLSRQLTEWCIARARAVACGFVIDDDLHDQLRTALLALQAEPL